MLTWRRAPILTENWDTLVCFFPISGQTCNPGRSPTWFLDSMRHKAANFGKHFSFSIVSRDLGHFASFARWCHQMETFSALLALCAGNSPVTGEFPSQRPVTRSFDVFLICAWTNGWDKQSRRWWFETPSWSLWRHCNVINRMLCELVDIERNFGGTCTGRGQHCSCWWHSTVRC